MLDILQIFKFLNIVGGASDDTLVSEILPNLYFFRIHNNSK